MVGPNSMHLIHIHVLKTDAIVFHFLPLIFNRTKIISYHCLLRVLYPYPNSLYSLHWLWEEDWIVNSNPFRVGVGFVGTVQMPNGNDETLLLFTYVHCDTAFGNEFIQMDQTKFVDLSFECLLPKFHFHILGWQSFHRFHVHILG